MSAGQVVLTRVSKPSMFLASLMILFGLLAIALPMVTSIGVALLVP